ncbi:uncharacterized protein EI97DRAFT_460865 [Westerdykella ornata]|uniref:Uncharacterized protein n=1 Tax=Westerdykella ornata TaxID=318751 RepID=A0A6A6JDG7_WESOR|nr:uncharacterized protein EI97DRAFT_460865 [Westerdykella ornata]KAF2273676.1 hypothetical protein EI97DRAFT_460865 [Westerdykella ornata]
MDITSNFAAIAAHPMTGKLFGGLLAAGVTTFLVSQTVVKPTFNPTIQAPLAKVLMPNVPVAEIFGYPDTFCMSHAKLPTRVAAAVTPLPNHFPSISTDNTSSVPDTVALSTAIHSLSESASNNVAWALIWLVFLCLLAIVAALIARSGIQTCTGPIRQYLVRLFLVSSREFQDLSLELMRSQHKRRILEASNSLALKKQDVLRKELKRLQKKYKLRRADLLGLKRAAAKVKDELKAKEKALARLALKEKRLKQRLEAGRAKDPAPHEPSQQASAAQLESELRSPLRDADERCKTLADGLTVSNNLYSSLRGALDQAKARYESLDGQANHSKEQSTQTEDDLKEARDRYHNLSVKLAAAEKYSEQNRAELQKAMANFDKLQDELKDAKDRSSNLQRQLDESTSECKSLREALEDSKKQESSLEEKLKGVDIKMEELEEDKLKLEQKLEAAEAKYTELLAELQKVKEEAQSASTQNLILAKEKDTLLSKCTQKEKELEGIVKGLEERDAQISKLKEDGRTMKAELSSNEDTLCQLHGTIRQLKGTVSERQNTIRELQDNATKLEDDKNAAERRLHKRIEGFEREKTSAVNAVTKTLQERLNEALIDKSKLEATVSTLRSDNVTSRKALDKLKGEVKPLKSELDDLKKSGQSRIDDAVNRAQWQVHNALTPRIEERNRAILALQQQKEADGQELQRLTNKVIALETDARKNPDLARARSELKAVAQEKAACDAELVRLQTDLAAHVQLQAAKDAELARLEAEVYRGFWYSELARFRQQKAADDSETTRLRDELAASQQIVHQQHESLDEKDTLLAKFQEEIARLKEELASTKETTPPPQKLSIHIAAGVETAPKPAATSPPQRLGVFNATVVDISPTAAVSPASAAPSSSTAGLFLSPGVTISPDSATPSAPQTSSATVQPASIREGSARGEATKAPPQVDTLRKQTSTPSRASTVSSPPPSLPTTVQPASIGEGPARGEATKAPPQVDTLRKQTSNSSTGNGRVERQEQEAAEAMLASSSGSMTQEIPSPAIATSTLGPSSAPAPLPVPATPFAPGPNRSALKTYEEMNKKAPSAAFTLTVPTSIAPLVPQFSAEHPQPSSTSETAPVTASDAFKSPASTVPVVARPVATPRAPKQADKMEVDEPARQPGQQANSQTALPALPHTPGLSFGSLSRTAATLTFPPPDFSFGVSTPPAPPQPASSHPSSTNPPVPGSPAAVFGGSQGASPAVFGAGFPSTSFGGYRPRKVAPLPTRRPKKDGRTQASCPLPQSVRMPPTMMELAIARQLNMSNGDQPAQFMDMDMPAADNQPAMQIPEGYQPARDFEMSDDGQNQVEMGEADDDFDDDELAARIRAAIEAQDREEQAQEQQHHQQQQQQQQQQDVEMMVDDAFIDPALLSLSNPRPTWPDFDEEL